MLYGSRRPRPNARPSSAPSRISTADAGWPSSSSIPARSATAFRPTTRSRPSTPAASAASMPVLVDSSLWVHQLRKSGEAAKRDRVHALLQAGEAAWCPPVRLELWRGVTSDAERHALRRYEAVLQEYEI